MSDTLAKIAEDSTRGGFFLTLGNLVSNLVSAISVFIIARILGPELYGLYSISTVVPLLLLLFIDPGINQGLIKYSASLRVKGEEYRIPKLLFHGLSFKALFGLAAGLVCLIYSSEFARVILNRPEIAPFIQLASTLIIFQAIFETIGSAFIGMDRTEYSALIMNIQAGTKAAVSSLLVILGLGVIGALSGYIIGLIVASVIGISIFFYKIYRSLNRQRDNRDVNFSSNLKLLARYGLPLYLSALVGGFAYQYQSILLAIFTPNQDVGNYRAALNFTVVISTFSIPMATALLPAFSKMKPESEDIKKFFRLSVKYTSIIILPIATLMILYSNGIVGIIYGEDYATAPYFLSLSAIQYYLIGLGSLVLGSFFNGLGETKTSSKISLMGSFIFIAVSPALIWLFKVSGLIISSLVSSLAASLYGLSIAKSRFKVQIEAKKVIRIYLASLMPVIPLLLIQRILPSVGLYQMAIGATLYLAIYLITIPLARIVTKSELEETKTILYKIKPLKIITKPLFYCGEKILS